MLNDTLPADAVLEIPGKGTFLNTGEQLSAHTPLPELGIQLEQPQLVFMRLPPDEMDKVDGADNDSDNDDNDDNDNEETD